MADLYKPGLHLESIDPAYVMTPGDGAAMFCDSTLGDAPTFKRSDGTYVAGAWRTVADTFTTTDSSVNTIGIVAFASGSPCAALFRVTVMASSATAPKVFSMVAGVTCTTAGDLIWDGDGEPADAGLTVQLTSSGRTVSLVLTGNGTATNWLYSVEWAAVH